MKKLVAALVITLVLCFGSAFGQVWHTANQVTVAWDAVITLENGDPLPATDIVKYKVWLKNVVTGSEPVKLGEVIDLEYTITLNIEGKYFVGASALRYSDEGELLSTSITCWSDVVECVFEGNTFGIRYYLPSASPGCIRIK